MSDTPETEAAWACFKGYMEPLQDVQNLSRKLERERDEAQADCLEQARLLGMGSEREARLISERDEALSQIVQAECRAERFCQERDEAREIIRRAKTKFCEEGSDGNIASDMFAILSL